MTDVFGSSFEGVTGYLFLADFASAFFIGFIAGFYLSYLIFTKEKLKPLGAASLSTIIGIFFGYFSFYFIPQIFGNAASNNNYSMYWLFNAPLVIIVLETVVVTIHFLYFRKRKKTTKRTSAKK